MNTVCMIELKKEYTTLLCQVLTPVILEGLQHLYNESKKNSTKNNILKTFQLLLKSIPSWDTDIVKKEIERINFKTKEYPWIIQLIQSIFKLNILINGLEPSEAMKKDIDMSLFIHTIYIECARHFWVDPFLFYHEYSSLEQKKNYCEIIRIIGCCIENAIRRLLPLGAIFDKFLGEKMFDGKSLDLFEVYNMPLILDIPIELELEQKLEQKLEQILEQKLDKNIEPNNEIIQNFDKYLLPVQENNIRGGIYINNPNNMTGGNNVNFNNNEPNEHNINEKILNIINKNNVLTDSNDINNNFTVNNHSANNMQNMIPQNMIPQNMQNMMPQNMMQQNMIPQNTNRHHSDRKSSSTLKRIVHESIKQSHNTATRTHSNASHNDLNNNSDIKNKILKDLDSDTITYNPEENAENYQDIFSNSDMKHTVNTNEKAEKKSREKFFNNYLNI